MDPIQLTFFVLLSGCSYCFLLGHLLPHEIARKCQPRNRRQHTNRNIQPRRSPSNWNHVKQLRGQGLPETDLVSKRVEGIDSEAVIGPWDVVRERVVGKSGAILPGLQRCQEKGLESCTWADIEMDDITKKAEAWPMMPKQML